MGDPSSRREALSLLGEVYRSKGTGVFSVAVGEDRLRAAVRDGQLVGIDPPPGVSGADDDPFSDPDDSARLKLEKVLVEVGLRLPPRDAGPGPSSGELRERLVSRLADADTEAGFDETVELPPGALPLAGGTEPLLLEAVRRVRDVGAIRELLGDLDQGVAAVPGLADERTLTLTEGALLARVDGARTARQILENAPLETDDAQRGLAGLLLTGRVTYEPVRASAPDPASAAAPTPPPPPGATPVTDSGGEPAEEAATGPAPGPPEGRAEDELLDSPPPPSPDVGVERQRIEELYGSLAEMNHFEVLGAEPGAGDAEIRRAYVARVKRFHPDAQRDPALDDVQHMLEAIFVRVSEAWAMLGTAESRSAYEARLRSRAGRQPEGDEPGEGASAEEAPTGESTSEKTLREAGQLLEDARFWDAIQLLEPAIPRLEPEALQQQGRIQLARAYARNPKWIRRAEKTLQLVVQEDPANAEAYYQLGVLYRAGGLSARAQAMFRKAVELRPGHRQAEAAIAPAEVAAPKSLLRRLFRG